jgi:phosphatidylglycerol lysyltransferase
MGLTAGEVAETSAFVILTFTAGLVAVFPVIALLDPSSLETLGISWLAGIAIGTLGLLLMAGYIGLGWWMERPIRLFGYPLHLPRPLIAGAQIALSVADLSLVAAVLYACLPHASAVGYPHVLAVYVLAFVVGLISHGPGGLGVFDAVVLVGLSTRLPADQILAGLLTFRVVYHLVPLVSAGALFGACGGTGGPTPLRADLGEYRHLGWHRRADGSCRLHLHRRRHAVVFQMPCR